MLQGKLHTICRVCLFAGLVWFLTACGNDRPQPFLDEEQMSDLMTDIRLIETHLYEYRETDAKISDRVMRDRTLDLYVPVFKKYGIDYKQFKALEIYYMNQPETMEDILRKSAEKLQAMVAEKDTVVGSDKK